MSETCDFGVDAELIIEPGRPAVLYFNVFYDEQASFGLCEQGLVYAKAA